MRYNLIQLALAKKLQDIHENDQLSAAEKQEHIRRETLYAAFINNSTPGDGLSPRYKMMLYSNPDNYENFIKTLKPD